MHDNAPIHTAHNIQEWLSEEGIEVMGWPPYSPDLNLIENLWALLKAEIYRLHPELIDASNTAVTLDLLIRCAISTWETLGYELTNTLMDTMKNSVGAVLEAKGCNTKY
jgi:transposase